MAERPPTDTERLSSAMSGGGYFRRMAKAEAERKKREEEPEPQIEYSLEEIPQLFLVKTPGDVGTYADAARFVKNGAGKQHLKAMLAWLNHPINIDCPTAIYWKKTRNVFPEAVRINDSQYQQSPNYWFETIFWDEDKRKFIEGEIHRASNWGILGSEGSRLVSLG